MQNPKVMKAFQDLMSGPGGPMGLMSNPAKLTEMMADPEVSENPYHSILKNEHIYYSTSKPLPLNAHLQKQYKCIGGTIY